jgi:hypothetical protein
MCRGTKAIETTKFGELWIGWPEESCKEEIVIQMM